MRMRDPRRMQHQLPTDRLWDCIPVCWLATPSLTNHSCHNSGCKRSTMHLSWSVVMKYTITVDPLRLTSTDAMPAVLHSLGSNSHPTARMQSHRKQPQQPYYLGSF